MIIKNDDRESRTLFVTLIYITAKSIFRHRQVRPDPQEFRGRVAMKQHDMEDVVSATTMPSSQINILLSSNINTRPTE